MNSKTNPDSRKNRIRNAMADQRSKSYILLAHCILNQNARYLGGASCPGCTPAALTPLCTAQSGLIQLPCPEIRAWGGVEKWLIWLPAGQGKAVRLVCRIMNPLFKAWTRLSFAAQARNVVRTVVSYRKGGWTLAGITGIDGSPSCGINKTLDLDACHKLHASLDTTTLNPTAYNHALYGTCLRDGRGLFMDSLVRQLKKKGIEAELKAWDLQKELTHPEHAP